MHVEIELPFQIMRTEFPKVSFIPDDDVRLSYSVEAGPAGEERVYDGCNMLEVLLSELGLCARLLALDAC